MNCNSDRALSDAHVHLWDSAALTYPWLAEAPGLPAAVTSADLMKLDIRADAVVLVEADVAPEQAEAELRWLDQQAQLLDVPAAIVAQCKLDESVGRRIRLADLAARDRVAGVRQGLQNRPLGGLDSPAMRAGLADAAAVGLTVDLCIRFEQFDEALQLLTQCHQTTVVLDHLGKPDVKTMEIEAWLPKLKALAKLDNVYVKLSGLSTEAGTGWTEAQLLPYLKAALSVMGAHRCLFGGDWPVATLTTSYERWVDLIRLALDDLPTPERALVWRDNAYRIYGVGLDAR